MTRCRWPAHGREQLEHPGVVGPSTRERPADQVRQVEVADRDRIGVAERPRRDLGHGPRADPTHGEQPSTGLGRSGGRRTPAAACATAAARWTVPDARLVDAGATPVPDGDGPPRDGVGRHAQGRRTRAGRRGSVLPHERAPRGLRVQTDDLLLEDRGDERLQHVGRAGDPQPGQPSVRVVDHPVQARVEAVRACRARRAGPASRRVRARRRAPRWSRGRRRSRWRRCRVAGPSGVRVACQTLPSGANDQAGSPPPRRRLRRVSRRSRGAAGR